MENMALLTGMACRFRSIASQDNQSLSNFSHKVLHLVVELVVCDLEYGENIWNLCIVDEFAPAGEMDYSPPHVSLWH